MPTGVVAIVVTACGAHTFALQRVVEPNRPILMRGDYFVLPPRGENWLVGGQEMVHEKRFYKVDGHTYQNPNDPPATMLRTFWVATRPFQTKESYGDSMDELHRWAVDAFPLGESVQGGRYQNVAVKITPADLQGMSCMSVDVIGEERHRPGFPVDTVLDYNSKYLFCRHPSSPKLLVGVVSNESRQKGTTSAISDALRGEVQDFFNSVRVIDKP